MWPAAKHLLPLLLLSLLAPSLTHASPTQALLTPLTEGSPLPGEHTLGAQHLELSRRNGLPTGNRRSLE